MNRAICAAAGIAAPGLRLGPAKRSQSASDRFVRVAGAMPGPALGPAVLGPALVFFDFPRPFRVREPGTRGLASRRMRILADEEVA